MSMFMQADNADEEEQEDPDAESRGTAAAFEQKRKALLSAFKTTTLCGFVIPKVLEFKKALDDSPLQKKLRGYCSAYLREVCKQYTGEWRAFGEFDAAAMQEATEAMRRNEDDDPLDLTTSRTDGGASLIRPCSVDISVEDRHIAQQTLEMIQQNRATMENLREISSPLESGDEIEEPFDDSGFLSP